jgi:hypothetical protein
MQGMYEFIQTKLAHLLCVSAPKLVGETVNFFFNTLFDFFLKPATELLMLAPDVTMKFFNQAMAKAETIIVDLIPPGIMNLFRKATKNLFRQFMMIISPELGKTTMLTVQLARALVAREKQSDAQFKERQEAMQKTPAPTPIKLEWESLGPEREATPAPTSPPTPPTPNPTSVPTPPPTTWEEGYRNGEGYNWRAAADELKKANWQKKQDKLNVDIPAEEQAATKEEEPGHVEGVNSGTSVRSEQSVYRRQKAKEKDPVFKHLSAWYDKNVQARPDQES